MCYDLGCLMRYGLNLSRAGVCYLLIDDRCAMMLGLLRYLFGEVFMKISVRSYARNVPTSTKLTGMTSKD